MKEAIFIFIVILALAALTAFRYRRHILSALEFYRAIQGIRERSPRQQMPDQPADKGPLAPCQKCGTWVPEDRAIRLGGSAIYCSSKCLESSKVA